MRVYGQRYQGKTELVRKRKNGTGSLLLHFFCCMLFSYGESGNRKGNTGKTFFSYIQNEISMSMTRQYIPTVAYMAEGRQEQTLSDFCWKK